MIFDASQALFSDDQAITATAISENVMQLPAPGTVARSTSALTRNLGAGVPIPLIIQVTETFATLTSLTVTLETSAAAGLTTPTVLWSSPAIAAASLVAGYKLPVDELPEATLLEYIGVRYTVTGSNATAGKITAGFTMGINTGQQ